MIIKKIMLLIVMLGISLPMQPSDKSQGIPQLRTAIGAAALVVGAVSFYKGVCYLRERQKNTVDVHTPMYHLLNENFKKKKEELSVYRDLANLLKYEETSRSNYQNSWLLENSASLATRRFIPEENPTIIKQKFLAEVRATCSRIPSPFNVRVRPILDNAQYYLDHSEKINKTLVEKEVQTKYGDYTQTITVRRQPEALRADSSDLDKAQHFHDLANQLSEEIGNEHGLIKEQQEEIDRAIKTNAKFFPLIDKELRIHHTKESTKKTLLWGSAGAAGLAIGLALIWPRK